MHSNLTTTIYVQLLEEGTDTWRPTQAIAMGNSLFKLLPTPNYDPENEVWEFLPESIVRGEPKKFRDGEQIVAVEQVG
jgi:hypothetical protein